MMWVNGTSSHGSDSNDGYRRHGNEDPYNTGKCLIKSQSWPSIPLDIRNMFVKGRIF